MWGSYLKADQDAKLHFEHQVLGLCVCVFFFYFIFALMREWVKVMIEGCDLSSKE